MTKSTVKSVRYTIYASNDSEILDYATQCETVSSKEVITIPIEEKKFKTLRE